MAPDPIAVSMDKIQDMISRILIETGKALKATNTASGRSMVHAKARFDSFLPSAENDFHAALDEIEWEILYARAILERDLHEIKAAKLKVEKPVIETRPAKPTPSSVPPEVRASQLSPEVKKSSLGLKRVHETPAKPTSQALETKPTVVQPKASILSSNPASAPRRPSTVERPVPLSQPVGESASQQPSKPATDSNTNINDTNFDFDNFDFSIDNPASSLPTVETKAPEKITLQGIGDSDLAMLELPPESANTSSVANAAPQSLDTTTFDLTENAGSNLDLRLDDMNVANNESMFDDSMFEGLDLDERQDDEANNSYMEPGEFDNAFFGLEEDS